MNDNNDNITQTEENQQSATNETQAREKSHDRQEKLYREHWTKKQLIIMSMTQ